MSKLDSVLISMFLLQASACKMYRIRSAMLLGRACLHLQAAGGCRLAGHQEWDKRNPTSVAGAVLYIIANLFVVAGKSSVKVSIEDISNMVSISANTIKAVTKDLQPFFPDLLPNWVATPEQVEQMIADGYAQT